MCLIIVGRKPVTMVMAIKCYHGDSYQALPWWWLSSVTMVMTINCYQATAPHTFVQAQHNRWSQPFNRKLWISTHQSCLATCIKGGVQSIACRYQLYNCLSRMLSLPSSHKTVAWIPYSGKLSRKKTLQIGEKYNFRGENFRGLLTSAAPKDATPPNFAEKTFANRHKTAKFAKVFSLKSFPLYGTL